MNQLIESISKYPIAICQKQIFRKNWHDYFQSGNIWHNSNITTEMCCDNVAQEKNVLMSQMSQNMSQGKKKVL